MAWPISWSQRGVWKPWSGYQERVPLLMVFSAILSWETRTLTTTTLLTCGINSHLFKCMKKWMLRKGGLLAQGHRLVRSNAMVTPHSCLWPPCAKYETHLWAGNLYLLLGPRSFGLGKEGFVVRRGLQSLRGHSGWQGRADLEAGWYDQGSLGEGA